VDDRVRPVAENEALFRQVNEHVVGAERRPAESFEILCECGDEACMDHVRVTTEAYERVRSQPTDFVLTPGHAIPEVETVVKGNDEFDVPQDRSGGCARQRTRPSAARRSRPRGGLLLS
jgi:hypothetical protein